MVSQSVQLGVLTFFMLFNGLITPGGIIYGWPGLLQQLKDEAEFADGCPLPYDPDANPPCASQDNSLSTIYTVAANVATIATVVYGVTLDRFGIRANAMSGAFFMASGFVLLAFSTSKGDHPFPGFIPGYALVAFGGLGTYLPSLKLISFYKRPTLVLSVISALFGVAGLTLTFLKFLHDSAGIERKTSYLAYACLVGFCGLTMFLFYPRDAGQHGDRVHLPVLGWLGIEAPPHRTAPSEVVHSQSAGVLADNMDYSPLSEGAETGTLKSHSSTRLDSFVNSPIEDGALVNSPSSVDVAMLAQERRRRSLTTAEWDQLKNSRTLKQEILHPGVLLISMYFALGLLCCNLYNENITSPILKQMGDTDGKFANAFVFIASLYPVVFSFSIDSLQKRFRYAGTTFISITGLIIGIAFLFTDNLWAQLPGFFFFATGRALMITVLFSFVAVEYRPEHYGRIIAFISIISGAVGFAQLGLQKLLSGPANNDFRPFAGGMIATLASLYVFTWWCHKNRV